MIRRIRRIGLKIKARAVLAAVLFVLFAAPGYFGTANPFAMWDWVRGPSLRHNTFPPYKTDKKVYNPGESVGFRFTRNTDFDGTAHVTYSIMREYDEDGDGVADTFAVDGGSYDRVLKPGKTNVQGRVPLPVDLSSGTYYVFFNTRVSQGAYYRFVESATERFEVKAIP